MGWVAVRDAAAPADRRAGAGAPVSRRRAAAATGRPAVLERASRDTVPPSVASSSSTQSAVWLAARRFTERGRPVTNRTRSRASLPGPCDARHTRALPSDERIHSRPPAGPKPAPPPVSERTGAAAVRAVDDRELHPNRYKASAALTGGLTELAWV